MVALRSAKDCIVLVSGWDGGGTAYCFRRPSHAVQPTALQRHAAGGAFAVEAGLLGW
jgi:hypothetical protein